MKVQPSVSRQATRQVLLLLFSPLVTTMSSQMFVQTAWLTSSLSLYSSGTKEGPACRSPSLWAPTRMGSNILWSVPSSIIVRQLWNDSLGGCLIQTPFLNPSPEISFTGRPSFGYLLGALLLFSQVLGWLWRVKWPQIAMVLLSWCQSTLLV